MKRYLILIITALLSPQLLLADMNSANEALARGDYARAVEEFRQLAAKGDAKAQSHLGYLYYVGEGVPQSYEEAVKWYREAAVQGDRDAQYNLAVAYAFGEGIKQDYKEAAVWYRRAAEQGHSVAQYSMGISYAYGEGVPQDEKLAAEWFLKSAIQGYESAQVMTGSLYHTGSGVPKDYAKAVEWYRKAADRGNATAQYNLGTMYRAGKGVTQDYNQAVRWFRMAADQGYIAAQNELAAMERSIAGATREQKATPPATVSQQETPVAAVTAPATPIGTGTTTVTEPVTPKETISESTTPPEGIKKEEVFSLKPAEEKSVAKPEATPVEGQAAETPSHAPEPVPAPASEQIATASQDEIQDEQTEESRGGIFGFIGKLFKSDEEPGSAESVTPLKEKSVAIAETTPVTEPTVQSQTTEPESPLAEESVAAEETPAPVEIEDEPRTEQPRTTSSNTLTDIWARPRFEKPQTEYAVNPDETDTIEPVETTIADTVPEVTVEEKSTSFKQTEISDEPVAEITPDTTIEESPASIDTDITGEVVTQSGSETTAEAETSTAEEGEGSGGLFGFFGRLFSSDKTQEEIVTEPAPGITDETSETGTETEAVQVAAIEPENSVTATIDEPFQQSPETISPVQETKPSAQQSTTATEPEQPAEPEITADVAEEPQKTGGLGKFFGKLFGSDEEVASQPDESTETIQEDSVATSNESPVEEEPLRTPDWDRQITEPEAETISQQQPPETIEKVEEEQVQTENLGVQPVLIAKTEPERIDTTISKAAEQEFESSTAPTIDAVHPYAVEGDPQAQYQLATMYYEGKVIEKDYEQAFLWYRRAALQGNAEAQYNLGTMYLMGEGIEQSDKEAKGWYEKAAAQGHAAAQHNLENLQRVVADSETETGVSGNIEQQTEPATENEKESGGVFGFLGGLFGSDDEESEEDIQTNATPANDSAETTIEAVPEAQDVQETPETSSAEADYERGLAYAHGNGVPQNHTTAFTYFQHAAEQGYAPAQYQLGVAYAQGNGIEQNHKTALEWYQKAAQQGYAIAQRSLGTIYMYGEGVEQNKPLALAWFSILAEQGNVLDIHRRDLLKAELTKTEIEEADRLKQQLMAILSTASTTF
ncbi:MAG: SEL1-like repeat protein [Gammaproteobacteria bacterium]|nr:SEL1-like repeat protein [Gammaproteobacteria bacterium]